MGISFYFEVADILPYHKKEFSIALWICLFHGVDKSSEVFYNGIKQFKEKRMSGKEPSLRSINFEIKEEYE